MVGFSISLKEPMNDSNFSKMLAGQWYTCHCEDLADRRAVARLAVYEHNTAPPQSRGSIGPLLRKLMAEVGLGVFVEAPFHCAYGFNVHLAEGVYLNAGCVILDSAPVRIGAGSLLGPSVHIYCAEHHLDRQKREAGIERAQHVTIGAGVWIGGGAIILPGITIGDGAIVGAGSVVTHDVRSGSRVAGNPARLLKTR